MRSTSRLALNALLAGLLLMAMAGPALATTTVSGDLDTNAPLEIDPTAAPVDAQTVDVDLAAYNPTVAFIQRMPVTKVVDRVTLGDFASAPGCGTPAALRLFVYEHAAGDFQTVSSQLTYSGYEELPSTPGRVSWSITPTTLRAGRGYSFYLGFDPGRCRYGRQTTWAHNGATVNAGPARCTNGPPAQPNRSTVKTRMWHTANADDRQLNCSNATCCPTACA